MTNILAPDDATFATSIGPSWSAVGGSSLVRLGILPAPFAADTIPPPGGNAIQMSGPPNTGAVLTVAGIPTDQLIVASLQAHPEYFPQDLTTRVGMAGAEVLYVSNVNFASWGSLPAAGFSTGATFDYQATILDHRMWLANASLAYAPLDPPALGASLVLPASARQIQVAWTIPGVPAGFWFGPPFAGMGGSRFFGVQVERSPGGGGPWTVLLTQAPGSAVLSNSLVDSDTSTSSTWCYRAKTIGGPFNSAYSPVACVTFPIVPPLRRGQRDHPARRATNKTRQAGIRQGSGSYW